MAARSSCVTCSAVGHSATCSRRNAPLRPRQNAVDRVGARSLLPRTSFRPATAHASRTAVEGRSHLISDAACRRFFDDRSGRSEPRGPRPYRQDLPSPKRHYRENCGTSTEPAWLRRHTVPEYESPLLGGDFQVQTATSRDIEYSRRPYSMEKVFDESPAMLRLVEARSLCSFGTAGTRANHPTLRRKGTRERPQGNDQSGIGLNQ